MRHLANLLSGFFGAATRSEGESDFKRGLVRIEDGDDDTLWAELRKPERAFVEIDLMDDTLTASCDCRGFTRQHILCRHIWAAILASDGKDHLSDVTRLRSFKFIPQFVPDSDDFDFEDEEGIYGAPVRHDGGAAGRRNPTWRQIFSEMSDLARTADRADALWPHDRELVYWIALDRVNNRDGLPIEVGFRARKRDGSWSKMQSWQIPRKLLALAPSEDDRVILASLEGAAVASNHSFHYRADGYGNMPSKFHLAPAAASALLPRMASSDRLFVRARDSEVPKPLRWDGGDTWNFRLALTESADDKACSLDGHLARGGETMGLAEAEVLHAEGWIIARGAIGRLDHAGAFTWIALLRKTGPITAKGSDAEKMTAMLMEQPVLPPCVLPERLAYTEKTLTPRPCLTLSKPGMRGGIDCLNADVSFEYGERSVSAADGTRRFVDTATRIVHLRDARFEAAVLASLVPLAIKPHFDAYNATTSFRIARRNLAPAIAALLRENWKIKSEGKLYRNPGAVSLSVTTGVDWFDLSGGVDYDGVVAGLPELLEAARRGDSLVALPDGSLGILPEEWLKKHGLVATMGKADGGRIRFTRGQAGLLDALLASQPEARCDALFAKVREEIRSFSGIRPLKAGSGFRGELRGYQEAGLGWFDFLRRFGFGGCLADDMGLGKTVMVLAMLDARRRAAKRSNAENGKDAARQDASCQDTAPPSLVVVPRSLIFNWLEESKRFTPSLRILDHSSPLRAKTDPDFSGADVVLTTYGILQRDILLFKERSFDYVILDEAQAIKTASAARAKAARLVNARHRLALSGTPIENHLGELWSLFEFLNPGLLGSSAVFQAMTRGDAGASAESREILARALRPFILRRTKEEVVRDLPEKTEQTIHCEMDADQQRLYDELKTHYRSSLGAKIERAGISRSKIQILEALLRLRQAACHPALVSKDHGEIASAKIELLMPRLKEVIEEGHKALVFSQFTSFLAIVRARLDAEDIAYVYLDGRTRDRQSLVEKFQADPAQRVFLISLKAGGLGLNLTSADYVFLLDPWWNPAVEAQAIDRTHRIGQTRPVHAYRIITRGTVEEKVVELQETKRNLAEAIIGGDKSLLRNLTREDLELLMS